MARQIKLDDVPINHQHFILYLFVYIIRVATNIHGLIKKSVSFAIQYHTRDLLICRTDFRRLFFYPENEHWHDNLCDKLCKPWLAIQYNFSRVHRSSPVTTAARVGLWTAKTVVEPVAMCSAVVISFYNF